VEHYAALIGS